jgi:hypothetical protein
MKWMPWRIALVAIAGWMNRQQQDVIAYLTAENRILREQLGPKRIILNESQKRRLARAAYALGRNVLSQIGTLFSPDTLLKWYRLLIARKYDGAGSRSKPGPEPTKAKQVRDHVIRMTTENPDWGYGRIHGELKALGFDVSWQTVRRVMLDLGLLPDPDKPYKTTWTQFIKSHFQSIAACDFFACETLGLTGLTRWLVFFVIDISTRRVHIAGIHHDPAEPQMLQMARNLTDCEDGFLKGKRILIHDRDPLFTDKFQDTLGAVGVRCLKMPKQSPNLNAYASCCTSLAA